MDFNLPKTYISQNLLYLRKKKKITQRQLGKLLGKDYSTIGKWESNINQPSIEDTFKLSIIFGVEWKEFILRDLSIEDNQYDEQIKKIASENGVEIIIDKNTPLTAETVVDIQKVLMKELENKNENKHN